MIRFIGNKILVIEYNKISLLNIIKDCLKGLKISYELDITSPKNAYITLNYENILHYNFFLWLLNQRLKDIIQLELSYKKETIQC